MPIIEGPDGAGKSTLAKSLADRLDMNILKMTANGGQSVHEYLQKLACDGVIIDRCWVSEHIYSDLFGREPRIGNDDAEALTDFCARVGIPIIVLLPPLHAYEKDIDRVREVWCCKHTASHLKLDIEKFLAHISEIERIAMSSNEPKHDIVDYCFNNAIIMEVNDEN